MEIGLALLLQKRIVLLHSECSNFMHRSGTGCRECNYTDDLWCDAGVSSLSAAVANNHLICFRVIVEWCQGFQSQEKHSAVKNFRWAQVLYRSGILSGSRLDHVIFAEDTGLNGKKEWVKFALPFLEVRFALVVYEYMFVNMNVNYFSSSAFRSDCSISPSASSNGSVSWNSNWLCWFLACVQPELHDEPSQTVLYNSLAISSMNNAGALCRTSVISLGNRRLW